MSKDVTICTQLGKYNISILDYSGKTIIKSYFLSINRIKFSIFTFLYIRFTKYAKNNKHNSIES